MTEIDTLIQALRDRMTEQRDTIQELRTTNEKLKEILKCREEELTECVNEHCNECKKLQYMCKWCKWLPIRNGDPR